MIEILNRQRKTPVPDGIGEFAASAASMITGSDSKTIAILFVSDRGIRRLNSAYRGRNSATDVLSFPFNDDGFAGEAPHLGDIVISMERAARQAVEAGSELAVEIKQLILHGILHLSGFDHESDSGEMDALELDLRRKLGIDDETVRRLAGRRTDGK